MRVLHVLDHSIPLHSGYSFRTLAIVREQQALGWSPFLLTSPKQNSGLLTEETVDKLLFFRTPMDQGPWAAWPVVYELRLLRMLRRRLMQVVKSVKPDVIHAHSPVLNGLPAWRVARALDLPLVYEIRAFWEDAAVEHGTQQANGLRYQLTRAAETTVMRRAAAITTICEGLKSDIVDRGIPADRVTVIPNAVDVERFVFNPRSDSVLRTALGLEGCHVLGFVGSFYRYEGLDILLKALQRLNRQSVWVKALLVGGGPEESRLRSLSAELGVTDSVVFTGRVPHEAVADYYGLIDLLVYPRLKHRLTELVTPLKPLEGMAQGKLVAGSDVGGHRELIRHAETGFLFTAESSEALAECVKDILTSIDNLDAIRRAARLYVEKQRTWKSSVQRYAGVYSRALNRSVSISPSAESGAAE